MQVFNEQSAILVRKLSQELNKDSFNLFPYITLCTLDIVCGKLSISERKISSKLLKSLRKSIQTGLVCYFPVLENIKNQPFLMT